MITSLPEDQSSSVKKFTRAVKSSNGDPPYPEDSEIVLLLCDQLISMLQPKGDQQSQTINRITPESRTVFIVHGHDEVNLLRLQRLLRERFSLNPVILMDEPSSGQTIIEKFERVANEAAYCIVLVTPDDQIISGKGEAAQARPNVTFELGWFYGRLGRSRVCILCKRGTSIHSDLSGVVRVEFIESVEETVYSLEKEIRQSGIMD